MLTREVADLLPYLTPAERAELAHLAAQGPRWTPLPGPQTLAYVSDADEVGYGGAAGGGKTDLAIGLALTRHQRTAVFRRNGTEHAAFLDRLAEVLDSRDGFNGKDNVWRFDNGQIDVCSIPNSGDETKYQGRPHDLLVFDEATNIPLAQILFLHTWVRSTQGVKCKILYTFNPPVTAEGRWVVEYFAPWLDDKHPNPAAPGELRWFVRINGVSSETNDTRQFVLRNGERVYDFDHSKVREDEIITPKSRTFIPARVTDNPYLSSSGYLATLQGLPEPLRSQMLYGDFNAGVQDNPWQVIPTAWVEAAMARWQPRNNDTPPMSSLGVDVARGGQDNTIIARRHDHWFDTLLVYPGSQTPNGPTTAGLVIAAKRDNAPIHLDVIGVGAAPYDFLIESRQQVIGVNVAESADSLDRTGRLQFFNLRSQLWWQFREALDPNNPKQIALPPNRALLAELCAPTWTLSGARIRVQSREEIIEAIGRSPDRATAVILAWRDTPKIAVWQEGVRGRQERAYSPFDKSRLLGRG